MKIGKDGRSGSRAPSTEEALEIAVAAFTHLAEDPERVERFAALSGIAPHDMRAAATHPGFFAAVLDHLAGHEPDLLAFADAKGIDPARVAAARNRLGGGEG